MTAGPLDAGDYREVVRRALAEDLGWGDATTEAVVPPGARATGVFLPRAEIVLAGLDVALEAFRQLDPAVAVETFRSAAAPGPDTVKRVLEHAHVYVPLAGIVDRGGEIAKLQKELAGVEKEATSLASKLGNERFVDNAPAPVVDEARARAAQLAERRQKLLASLAELGA